MIPYLFNYEHVYTTVLGAADPAVVIDEDTGETKTVIPLSEMY